MITDTTDPGAKKTVEEWATAAKLFPQLVEESPKPRNREPRLVANREFWKFAAARAGAGWAVGQEMTKADFDDAIAKYSGHPDHPERVTFGVRDIGELANDEKAIARIKAKREERDERDAKAAAEVEAKAKAAAKAAADAEAKKKADLAASKGAAASGSETKGAPSDAGAQR